jgi:multisubunit Na+/H+ antiporter MnhC subunit
MKPKQLANVLTRILGLSLCAHGVPALIMVAVRSIALLVQRMHDGNPNFSNHYPYMGYPMVYYITPVVEFAIGIYLILRSRLIVEKLFKDEAE